MTKKNQNEIYQGLDQATNKVQEIIEIQDEDPILMLEKAKNFAKEFLGIIEGQKRKLSEEYELDLQALEAQKKKYTYSNRFSVYRKQVSTKQAQKLEKDNDAGKIKGLFNSHTSADSLKSSYHHAIKRAKKTKITFYLSSNKILRLFSEIN